MQKKVGWKVMIVRWIFYLSEDNMLGIIGGILMLIGFVWWIWGSFQIDEILRKSDRTLKEECRGLLYFFTAPILTGGVGCFMLVYWCKITQGM